jgi:hypothetical protein
MAAVVLETRLQMEFKEHLDWVVVAPAQLA